MLRSLANEEPERFPAWPSIEDGLEAKRQLERCRIYFECDLMPQSFVMRKAQVKCIVQEALQS